MYSFSFPIAKSENLLYCVYNLLLLFYVGVTDLNIF